jgi:hypothetical protein
MEQLRVVGLAVRREGIALASFVALWLLIIPQLVDWSPEGIPTYVDPADIGYLAVLLGLITPIGVWKGESLFGESQLWSLPVDHALHARLKVVAGWVWLMALVVFGLLSFRLFLELIDASTVQTRWVVANPADPFGPTTPRVSVQWSAPLWQWMLPFSAATAGYLAGSALLLGLRRPLYWAAGIWLALIGLAEISGIERFTRAERLADSAVYAFDLLASGGSQYAHVYTRMDSGELVTGWSRLPTPGVWVVGTTAWLALAGAAVWAASSRRREG